MIVLTVGFFLGIKNQDRDEGSFDRAKHDPKIDQSLYQAGGQRENASETRNLKEGLAVLMGKKSDLLVSTLGNPDRVDPSIYGYDWWIYNKDPDHYVQVGVEGDKIVTVYAIGAAVNISPFKIGEPVSEIFSIANIETNINLEYKNNSYRFELSEEDLNIRPLVQIGSYFVQLYIDKFTGKLSSIRFIDAAALIKQQPYELVYRGELVKPAPISPADWEKIETGSEKQIFDITNIMRKRHGLNALKWDEKTAQVAYMHSKDMFDSNYFSHTSEKYGTLADRLDTAEVFYQLAGENIAANYIDAPAVMEGWLNSIGHRKSLLNKEFTHIGVGVYRKNYTQNFLQRWEE